MAKKEKAAAVKSGLPEGTTYSRPVRANGRIMGQTVVPGTNNWNRPTKGQANPAHQRGYAECIFCDNEHAEIQPQGDRIVFTCPVCRAVWFFSGSVLRNPVKEVITEKDFDLAVDLGAVSKDEADAHYAPEEAGAEEPLDVPETT